MNAYAFVLVTLTLVALLGVIAAQALENRTLRADLRRFTDRVLNALVADSAEEMAGLDKGTVAGVSDETAEFLAREAREARAVERRQRIGAVDPPPRHIVGME